MICDKCRYYYVSKCGTAKRCYSTELTPKEKKVAMNGDKKHCKGYEVVMYGNINREL